MANTGQTARGHRNRLMYAIQLDDHTVNSTASNFWENSYTAANLMGTNTETELQISDTDDGPSGYIISKAEGTADFTVLSDPTSIGALWTAHLGLDTVATKQHTVTKVDAPKFVTAYFMRPDVVGGTDIWERIANGFVDTVELGIGSDRLITHKATVKANTAVFNQAGLTIVAGSAADGLAGDYRQRSTRIPTSNSLLTANGATVLFDLATTPAATATGIAAAMENVTITSSFPNFTWIQTEAFQPTAYWSKGNYQLTCTVTAVFTDFKSFASTVYGSATVGSAMAQSAVTVYGAADFTFPIVAGTASFSEQLKLLNMRWRVAPPALDPSGNAVRVTLTGTTYATTTPLQVILNGDRATTAYGNSA